MFALISVTRDELEICTSFYNTKEEAYNTMLENIKMSCNYESIKDIKEDAKNGQIGLSDDKAWAETSHFGTGQWNIVEVPLSV